MSEYQCYEFVAIDRPLTEDEIEEIRELSTRAEISPTRFWNEYHYGDFRGDPEKLVAKYFDAHHYFANWGSRRFMFRIPLEYVDVEPLRSYFGDALTCTKTHAIFDFQAQIDGGNASDITLGELLPVRTEAMRGDRRFAYLAWLLTIQEGTAEDDGVEPPVPPGLGDLSEALAAMADFLEIDGDLIDSAAEASAPISDDAEALVAWVKKLPAKTKDEWLVRAAENPELALGGQLLRAFRATKPAPATRRGRTVSELRARADAITNERLRIETEKRQRAKEAQQKAKAAAFSALAKRADAAWKELEAHIAKSDYLEALKVCGELHDLAAHEKDMDAFQTRFERLKQAHFTTRRGFFVRWGRQRRLRDGA